MQNQLIKKLKIKPANHLVILNAPENYLKKLQPLPEKVTISKKIIPNVDWAQFFVKTKKELDRLFPTILKMVKSEGIIWITYPKGSSGIQTDLTRDKGWENIMRYNLQWLSLIAIDETWTAFALRNAPAQESKKKKADTSEIEKYIDVQKRMVKIPPSLKQIFHKNKKAQELFEKLAFSHRREYVEWIVGAKQEETRMRRLRLMVEKLMKGKKNPSDK